MNLNDGVEFEQLLEKYAVLQRARPSMLKDGCACSFCIETRGQLHNARCALVAWVNAYTANQTAQAVSRALEDSRRNMGPIADTSGGN